MIAIAALVNFAVAFAVDKVSSEPSEHIQHRLESVRMPRGSQRVNRVHKGMCVMVAVVAGFWEYSTWSMIAGSTIWCKFIGSFALSRHAHASWSKRKV